MLLLIQCRDGTVEVSKETLASFSDVVRKIIEDDPTFDTWNLKDFSVASVRQFEAFTMERELPTKTNEFYELLFLANYMECPALVRACSDQIISWFTIPQNVVMANHFGMSTSIPSHEMVVQYTSDASDTSDAKHS